MFFGGQRRKRSERLAGLVKVPGKWEVAWSRLRRTEVGLRILLVVVAATILTCVIQAWHVPPPPPSDAGLALDSLLGLPAGTLAWHVPPSASQPDLLQSPEPVSVTETLGTPEPPSPTVPAWYYRATRFAAFWLLISGCLAISGVYLFYRERRVLVSVRHLLSILGLMVLTVFLSRWLAQDMPYAEAIPLLVFVQTLAVAYHRELALLFGGVTLIIFLLASGLEVGAGLLWGSVLLSSILQLDAVRTRTKLLTVNVVSACVGITVRLLIALGNQLPFDMALFNEVWRLGLACLVTGFLMNGLLPFIERFFGVLTDMTLLELGHLSHPLLRELARRAPSTYNHSINVGAIAEAAAESIGARGLLARVGAYFHDIGKMLKPNYFIENQADSSNKHEFLEPTISSLVIIAHVKDGADLARQHHLPEMVIDFIEQHHGTTLVEYFYERARGKQETQPEGQKVDENNFRYPGPKPQTKEAAVLMLADAVESAVRSLKDPAPSRIETVVRDISERKLHQGQFDETNLTLRELRTIEDSLIKSLVAMYHGRIKYPERRTEDRRETERRTSEFFTSGESRSVTLPDNGRSSSSTSPPSQTASPAVSLSHPDHPSQKKE